ncbi:hypothetical protein CI105_00960 [Candidatus Izimaplasma bacterium ZiA1]|uniref:Cof-type HAD-IIB family hydrolase n=1 Tax=Candidatus Izimoplasma sp. ZiA1 TaxID=2024899 RepID=UPI000BAA434A|nr:hypothetical protein CI105_00960 [Candidatus Izimaplasma bacterium ZiA1]
MKKMIFVDLDGTVLDHSTNSIPTKTIKTIKELRENGHEVILCTGRCPSLFYGMDKEMGVDSYIAANGRYVLYKGTVVSEDTIEYKYIDELVKFCDQNQIDVGFEGINHYTSQNSYTDLPAKFSEYFHLEVPEVYPDFYKNHKVLQMVLFYNKEDYKNITEKFPNLTFHFANDCGMDVNQGNGMKDLGISRLLEHTNFSIENTIAIGDGFNDISMIEYCNYGIAMGNGNEELKAKADYVTDDVSKDGFYKAFKKLGMVK